MEIAADPRSSAACTARTRLRTAPVRLAAALAVLVALGCERGERPAPAAPGADERGHTPSTPATAAANATIARSLALAEGRDLESARRGLVASDPEVVIERSRGGTLWDSREYAFIRGEAPDSVNPSLWRQATLNGIQGLFEVVPGIYQVRGYDLSNLSLIEGRTGWILVDPLTSEETAAAALALARRHLGERPITAVILTHSHIDHFGGIRAVVSEGDVARGVRIVAPAGFLDEATSENVLAGIPMARRAAFMYGMPLARGPRGHVDSGLGRQPAVGRNGVLAPTDVVDHTPQEIELDGVRFVFQYAPHSEAPAELTFYLPHARTFCGAEIVSRTMHNLYTLRGAKVRDALRWSGYIDEAIRLFGDRADVVFNSHHWPVFGDEDVLDYLRKQRDTYKFIHDQTLRLASQGATPREIAEQLELPASLAGSFANRGYYGTLRHNAKAVYQAYFGWFDGNPANLDPLPPAEEARRYVRLMGGPAAVREQARQAFERGEYRWVATLLNHVVFARPDDGEARELLARAYDQLGYRAESGPWRDVYLTGAHELRHGVQGPGVDLAGSGLLGSLAIERFFEAMATLVNGPEAEDESITLNFVFPDLGESFVLWVENAVLHHRRSEPVEGADATIRITRDLFTRLVTRRLGLREAIFSEELAIEGSRTAVLSFFMLLDRPDPTFPIVTP